jgi:diaminohydroxyphosphoribosylaminopyrimidine deaminase/5-amino-6-(5-phosphoribosylamino)uracil reductase
MARAIQFAGQGRFTAHPNPMVGCVLVSNGEIVGEGWHEKSGSAHAEIHALRVAGVRARGATAYVTLEPCVHHGKTPPCVDALIEAGVREVVMALEDPFPKVRGRGREALEAAGIAVRVGLMQATVEDLLAGYLMRVRRGRPFVRLKLAASLDGRVAMESGQSQWITGPEARTDVQRLRAAAGAVMTGIGTVLADDPSLTVRDPAIDTQGKQPARVVLDSHLRMPLSARMLALPGRTLIFCSDDSDREPLIAMGVEVIKVARKDDAIDVAQVLKSLAERQVNELLVEAGPGLAGRLVADKLVDELVIYQAPHIMGSETVGMFLTPMWTKLGDRQQLDIADVRRFGRDTRITARISD